MILYGTHPVNQPKCGLYVTVLQTYMSHSSIYGIQYICTYVDALCTLGGGGLEESVLYCLREMLSIVPVVVYAVIFNLHIMLFVVMLGIFCPFYTYV